MSKTIRCLACGRRIRDHHPHIGVVDYDTGVEFTYHARPECQMSSAEETMRRGLEGKVYILRHYHTCGDEAAGFDCWAGCFRP